MKIKELIIGAALFVSSALISQNNYNMTVRNDVLTFASISDYKKVIGGLNKEQKIEFLSYLNSNVNFSSLAKNKDSELFKNLSDDFIEFLVNKDGYINIGNHVYKLDPSSKVVAVVESSKFNAEIKTQLDSKTYTSSDVRVYSMLDDVLGLVESNTPPSNSRLFCGESGAGEDEKSQHIDLNSPNGGGNCGWVDCWVAYKKFGIYFHLYARYINMCNTRTIYIHKTPVGGKVKCGYSWGPMYQWDIPTGNVVGVNWTDSYYQNVQPLNAYWVRIVFMAKDKNWIGNPDNPSADLEIRKNM